MDIGFSLVVCSGGSPAVEELQLLKCYRQMLGVVVSEQVAVSSLVILQIWHLLGSLTILSLLQAKVAEELSAATGQLSLLQLEVTTYQKKEMDLRTQLAASLQEAEKCRVELGSLQAQLIGECTLRCGITCLRQAVV